MNRLRKINNKYEILIIPQLLYQPGLELMLGNWIDKNFNCFKIKQYNDAQTAINMSCKYSEINFDQLVLFHKEIYNKLYELVVKELEQINEKIILTPQLLDSYSVRNNFFNRVKLLGDDFRLLYHMTDIISFDINVKNKILAILVAKILSSNQSLRIIYKIDTKYIKLVGQTDIGTTYEINIYYS